jgi:hypothetical protein
MSKVLDKRKHILADLELTPRVTSAVPAGSDGQVAQVTDKPGINLFVRKGGVLVPAVDTQARLYNAARLDIVVDPILGVRPANGTTITTQAEYAALGADLLYVQDVFRILPPYQGYYVHVLLKSGTHLGDPASLPFTTNYVLLSVPESRGFWPQASEINGDSFPPDYDASNNRAIKFVGESNTVLEAVQDGVYGVSPTNTIIRDVGTWTDHEHQGKYALIKSGEGIGKKFLIDDNDTTTLYSCNSITESGDITFEIVEPSAVIDDSSAGINIANTGGLTYMFENIKFNFKMAPFVVGGTSSFRDCLISTDVSTSALSNSKNKPGATTITNCWVSGCCNLCYGSYIFSESVFINSQFGATSVLNIGEEAVPYFNGIVVRAKDIGSLSVDELVRVSSPCNLSGTSGMILKGDTFCNGVCVIPHSFVSFYTSFIVNNCAVAVKCDGTTVFFEFVMGAGNTVGWDLLNGASIKVQDPASLVATTELSIDGVAYTYSARLPAIGDGMTGVEGSTFLRCNNA